LVVDVILWSVVANVMLIGGAAQRERLERTLHMWQEQQAMDPASRPDGQALWAQYDQLTGMANARTRALVC
jgi:hypothetical protein